MLEIRRATADDLPEITEIYNDAILKTVATFDTETKTIEDRRAWLEHHGSKYPVLVAVEDGVVKGWASLTPWSERLAYAGTVENSVYVKEEFRCHGIGKALLDVLMEEGKKAGFHTVIARIAETNDVSIRLHEKAEFKTIGVMEEVGVKFGKLLDVYMMQKIYR
jgi:phosphinothricin acetyltransferase